MSGVFQRWQPIYAEHRIATFPCAPTKAPAVRNYAHFGVPGSKKLVSRFGSHNAFGFMCGKRSRITPLDIDCKDERVLADALSRHGKTPIIAQSGNGNFQAWYRYNGERRQIRPWPGLPIDILGGGFVVAPPSEGEKGRYQFIQGSLEDLDQLSVLRNLPQVSTPPIQTSAEPSEWREGDCRDNELFRRLMRLAHQVDNFEQLLDYAQTHNSQFAEPMADAEVVKVTSSVWGYQCTGRNRFGTFGSWSPLEEVTNSPAIPMPSTC